MDQNFIDGKDAPTIFALQWMSHHPSLQKLRVLDSKQLKRRKRGTI
jgi:hypothetical protein